LLKNVTFELIWGDGFMSVQDVMAWIGYHGTFQLLATTTLESAGMGISITYVRLSGLIRCQEEVAVSIPIRWKNHLNCS
jgi:hypothetical protein